VTASPRLANIPAARGHLRGTAVVGALDHYVKRFGAPAAHETFKRLSAAARSYVDPHAPAMGLLGSRSYPYAVVGEILRVAGEVVRIPEDAFLREVTAAAVDAQLGTVGRVLVHYLGSVELMLSRAQANWDLFHDSGRVHVLSITDRDYVVQVTELANHDVTVCKVSAEGRRRIAERIRSATEKRPDVQVFREKCVAWGDDACITRVRYR
jgi:hypothetical protein